MRPRHVAIVGAGPAGLACAIALRQAGIDVTLVERASRERTKVDAGGGYELTTRALQALESIGAREGVEARGQRLGGFELRTASGRVLQQLDFEAAGLRVLAVTRSQLVSALWERLEGCTVLDERTVTNVERDSARVRLELSGGERLEADVVIGADGVHSELRRRFFDDRPPIELGLGAWWGRTASEMTLPGLSEPVEDRRTKRTLHAAGGPSSTSGRRALGLVAPGVSFVMAEGTGAGVAWTVCARSSSLEDAVQRLPRAAQAVVQNASSVASTRLLEQRPLETWWRDGVLLLGDAAHGMAPFLGLGANLALEDAVLFAGALVRGEPLGPLARRRAREVNPFIGQARRLASSMHFENGLAHALWCGVTRLVPASLVLRSMRERHG